MCSKPAAKHRCLTVRCACVSCSCRLVWWLWLLDGHIPPGESTRVLCCHTVCALLVWAVHARAASVVGMYLKQGWSHSCSYCQYSMTTSVGTGSAVLGILICPCFHPSTSIRLQTCASATTVTLCPAGHAAAQHWQQYAAHHATFLNPGPDRAWECIRGWGECGARGGGCAAAARHDPTPGQPQQQHVTHSKEQCTWFKGERLSGIRDIIVWSEGCYK
jgi:hypothetical protein